MPGLTWNSESSASTGTGAYNFINSASPNLATIVCTNHKICISMYIYLGSLAGSLTAQIIVASPLLVSLNGLHRACEPFPGRDHPRNRGEDEHRANDDHGIICRVMSPQPESVR